MKFLRIIILMSLPFTASLAWAQPMMPEDILEQSAAAMGGLERIRNLDSLLMTGFSQTLGQDGGSAASPHPSAPGKWAAQNSVRRYFDLDELSAFQTHRQGFLYPFALALGHAWLPSAQVQNGIQALNHPLTALKAALGNQSELGAVSIEDDNIVVEFTINSGTRLWLGINQLNKLPAWVRWSGPHNNLGEVTYTTWFTGYVPFEGIRLPSGFTTSIDWRDNVITEFHVDGYEFNVDLPVFESASRGFGAGEILDVDVTTVAEGVWDLRLVTEFQGVETNGTAIVEFEDHLLMFEAYGSEEDTFALIDAANTLVPGKQVTKVVMSHHHFDHSGGIRAAVSRGLTVISKRENEGILREMTSRPAPNFPDALARNPQPLKFIPVDEHLVLEDASRRVDVYEVIGHMHMTNAVFAYIPQERILMQGDMFVIEWDWHWWGDNYMDSIEYFDLDPAIDIPVHGRVATFAEVIENINTQVAAAREFCVQNETAGIYMAGCPVKYSRD